MSAHLSPRPKGGSDVKGCRSLEPAEIQAIASNLSLRDRAIFVLGIRAGFRINELLSLNVSDVVNESGAIVDSIRVRKASMKGKQESRVVPLHSECKEAIKAWLSECRLGLTEPLFKSRFRGRLDDSVFRKALKKASTRASIRDVHLVSTHSMRKTFAKKFFNACGRDIYLTQQALGHSHISITVKYLQEDKELVSNLILNLQ